MLYFLSFQSYISLYFLFAFLNTFHSLSADFVNYINKTCLLKYREHKPAAFHYLPTFGSIHCFIINFESCLCWKAFSQPPAVKTVSEGEKLWLLTSKQIE